MDSVLICGLLPLLPAEAAVLGGQENAVRGVNLMQVGSGQIIEALGYAKIPADHAPLSGK